MKKNTKRPLQLNAKTLFKFKKMNLDGNAFNTTHPTDTDPTTTTMTTVSTVNMMQSI